MESGQAFQAKPIDDVSWRYLDLPTAKSKHAAGHELRLAPDAQNR
jgi:hypothetical protein